MNKEGESLKDKIIKILKEDIYYDQGQLGTYVIHGAVEKLCNLLEKSDAVDFVDFILEKKFTSTLSGNWYKALGDKVNIYFTTKELYKKFKKQP